MQLTFEDVSIVQSIVQLTFEDGRLRKAGIVQLTSEDGRVAFPKSSRIDLPQTDYSTSQVNQGGVD